MPRRLIPILLAACSSDPAPPQPAPPPTLVPISPDYAMVGDQVHCARFVTELVKHPNWSLQVLDANEMHSGAPKRHDRYVIHHDGRVAWTAYEMRLPERELRLTAAELARIGALGALSCESTEHVDMERSYTLAWGESPTGGDRVWMSSDLGRALSAILDTAIARYVASRLQELAPITVTGDGRANMLYGTYSPTTAVYHLVLAPGGLLTVTRANRQLEVVWLQPAEVVDVVDKVLAPRAADPEEDWLRGSVTAGGRTSAFAWPAPRELWANAEYRLIQAVDDAWQADPRRPRLPE